MRKILGLTVAAVLVMGLVGGGTWAYFSDTESTTGNIFTAGTLDLGVDNATGQTPTGSTTATFGGSTLAPGGVAASGTLYVYNAGNLDMSTVNVTFSKSSFTDNTPTSVTGWDGSADTDNLTKMLVITDATWGGTTVAALEGQSIEDLITTGTISLGSGLTAGQEKALYLEWTFDATATNGCQGDEVDITVQVDGYQ